MHATIRYQTNKMNTFVVFFCICESIYQLLILPDTIFFDSIVYSYQLLEYYPSCTNIKMPNL